VRKKCILRAPQSKKRVRNMPLVLHRGNDRRAGVAGFTLVELGVVVFMMAVLAALLLPALAGAKERSKRAVCQSNIRQVLFVLQFYAMENEDKLPSAADNMGYYHSIRLSDQTFSNLVQIAGTSNILYCPNIEFGEGPVAQHDKYGYVIGYNYLANDIQTTPKGNDPWVYPTKLNDSPTNELIADPNFWTVSASPYSSFPSGMKLAPHGVAGAAMASRSSFTVGLKQGVNSAGIGAAGGNIGFLDGSVVWRNIKRMQTWQASSALDSYGNW
jgi:prepilin-type processing-associated H-X9-DG protein